MRMIVPLQVPFALSHRRDNSLTATNLLISVAYRNAIVPSLTPSITSIFLSKHHVSLRSHPVPYLSNLGHQPPIATAPLQQPQRA